MAKILPGPMIAQASGSIGGTVFSHNRFGMYTRNRTKPTVPTSEYFLTAVARMSAASIAWKGLPLATRITWNTWAQINPVTDSLGQSQILTGHQCYTGNHVRRALLGTGVPTVPPVSHAPAALTSLTLSTDIGAGAFEVAFTATPLDANDRLYIQGCLLSSEGIEYVQNLLRLFGFSGAAQASPFDIEAAFTTRFGTPQVGNKIVVFASVINGATGLLSTPLRDSATVVST